MFILIASLILLFFILILVEYKGQNDVFVNKKIDEYNIKSNNEEVFLRLNTLTSQINDVLRLIGDQSSVVNSNFENIKKILDICNSVKKNQVNLGNSIDFVLEEIKYIDNIKNLNINDIIYKIQEGNEEIINNIKNISNINVSNNEQDFSNIENNIINIIEENSERIINSIKNIGNIGNINDIIYKIQESSKDIINNINNINNIKQDFNNIENNIINIIEENSERIINNINKVNISNNNEQDFSNIENNIINTIEESSETISSKIEEISEKVSNKIDDVKQVVEINNDIFEKFKDIDIIKGDSCFTICNKGSKDIDIVKGDDYFTICNKGSKDIDIVKGDGYFTIYNRGSKDKQYIDKNLENIKSEEPLSIENDVDDIEDFVNNFDDDDLDNMTNIKDIVIDNNEQSFNIDNFINNDSKRIDYNNALKDRIRELKDKINNN